MKISFTAVGPFLNNEGSGLYVLQSSVNHSCIPNAVVEFPYSNNTLVLKAIRNIKVGEEICTSYLDECQLERSRHSRQQALSSLYLFVCHCDKCQAQANDPDITSDEEESDEDWVLAKNAQEQWYNFHNKQELYIELYLISPCHNNESRYALLDSYVWHKWALSVK